MQVCLLPPPFHLNPISALVLPLRMQWLMHVANKVQQELEGVSLVVRTKVRIVNALSHVHDGPHDAARARMAVTVEADLACSGWVILGVDEVPTGGVVELVRASN